jgi:2-polyprenyl-3-methyl-5-hydroxy-6-metoxy-1,4-benzoquinol methylase
VTSRYQADIDIGAKNNTHTSLLILAGENRRVLELGAASGYMTRVLQDRGCEVTAVELDPTAIDELKAIATDTVVGDLNDADLLEAIEGPFDVVLAGDVLEHLVDPLSVLRACVAKLTPAGAVVISLPNVAHVDLKLSLLQGKFEYQGTGLLDDSHLHFFTYRTMLDLLDQASLLVTDIHRIVVHPFESELAVPRGSVTPEVLEAALSIPEAETYQFVVRAVRDDGDPNLHKRSQRALSAGVKEDRRRLRELKNSPGGQPLERHVEQLNVMIQDVSRDRDEARAVVDDLQGQLVAAHGRLAESGQTISGLQTEQRATEVRLSTALTRAADLEAEVSTALTRAADLEAEVSATRRELVAACIGESQRARLKADNDALTAAINSARIAIGPSALALEPVEAVMVMRSRLDALERSRSLRVATYLHRGLHRLLPVASRRRALLRRIYTEVRSQRMDRLD